MTLGSHQRAVGKSQVYTTPKWILDALGPFDLDPCAADPRPWDCAQRNITEAEDGLEQPWSGRVWLNPPFDRRQIGQWVKRLAEHGEGTLLVHARTETDWFHAVWSYAQSLLFLAHRVTFCRADGSPHSANSGAPVVLAAFGAHDTYILSRTTIPGVFVRSWRRP